MQSQQFYNLSHLHSFSTTQLYAESVTEKHLVMSLLDKNNVNPMSFTALSIITQVVCTQSRFYMNIDVQNKWSLCIYRTEIKQKLLILYKTVTCQWTRKYHCHQQECPEQYYANIS